ncbi:expressed unknown protein [Seminavis robusta]|uniref:Uncharacterized protein n=1 Tax=Seminavis robusta TaxID=568900 RepID=A0A9N8DXD6_9STRA|nr:expressed unknown protein [Seminavis robusta]|eukprot:Sro448_g145090.1 n/a (416) ;mRNA; f:19763-21010
MYKPPKEAPALSLGEPLLLLEPTPSCPKDREGMSTCTPLTKPPPASSQMSLPDSETSSSTETPRHSPVSPLQPLCLDDTPPNYINMSNHNFFEANQVPNNVFDWQMHCQHQFDHFGSMNVEGDDRNDMQYRYLYPNMMEFPADKPLFQQAPFVVIPQPLRPFEGQLSTAPQPQHPSPPVVQIGVPFLVNYDDTLTYGPQRLPTLMEVEDEDDESSECSQDQLEQDSDSSMSMDAWQAGDHVVIEPSPQDPTTEEDEEHVANGNGQSTCYTFVDCYPDHHWDVVNGNDVLNDAMYYHVLEVNHARASSNVMPVVFPSMPSPPPLPTVAPSFSGGSLVRPQPLRVVCPTTIAPVIRHEEEEEVDAYSSSAEPAGTADVKRCLEWYRSYLDEEGEAAFCGYQHEPMEGLSQAAEAILR